MASRGGRRDQRSAAAATTLGIRATLVPYVADQEGDDYFETIETNRRRLESHPTAADGRVRSWVGLEHLFYCSPAAFRAAADLAEEFDTGIHTPDPTASRSEAVVTCMTRSRFSSIARWHEATSESASRSEPSGCTSS